MSWRPPPAWSWRELVRILLIAGVGLGLRVHGYTQAPRPSDNFDEFAWAWSGLTLITRHVPYGWSYLSAYRSSHPLHAFGTTFPIVHPYLDHPPLFSWLIGGVAWLNGARQLTDVRVATIRPVAIALGVLAVVLAYILGRRVFGMWPAFAGSLLLATAPAAVLFSRQVESEALLAPLLLTSLILVHRELTGEGGWPARAGIFACCLAASLTKVPGIGVGGAAALVLLATGRWKPAVLAAAGTVGGLLIYALYGAAIDWNQFLAVIDSQEGRRHGVMAAYEFIAAPAGLGFSLRDGWWLLGWIGIGALARRRRHASFLLVAVPALVYASTMMILADQRVVPLYGWYRITVYPTVYLAAGALAWQAATGVSMGSLLAVLILGGATATTALFSPAGRTWGPSALVLVVALGLPAAIAAMRTWKPGDRRLMWSARAAGAGLCLGLVACNLLASLALAGNYTLL